MRWSINWVALAVEVAVVTAQSGTHAPNTGASVVNPDPCAVISSRAVSYISASPKATTAVLKPSEVYACLKSVPYDQDRNVKQVAWMQNVFQFHSTLAYLKNPPPGYPLPAVDLIEGLKNISATITSGRYTNEYDIELDLFNIANAAYDGHLAYTPFLLGRFRYHHGISLVSVSLDGVLVPKNYFRSDFVGLPNASFTPSAVTSINGQDIKSITQYGRSMQDLDALYNSVLYSPATAGNPDGMGTFERGFSTQNDDTTSCTFENGTTTVVNATVEINALYATTIPANGQNFSRLLTTVESNHSSTLPLTTPTSSSTASALPSPLPLGTNYPTPFVKSHQNYISGHFMNGTDYSDLAVLSVASFDVTPAPADSIDFLQASTAFLAKCASAGKKRLIIDLRNNPGGAVMVGYALFQQLFPNIVPYSGVRMRGSDAANALGQIASTSPQSDDPNDLTQSVFNAQKLLQQPHGPSFDSWQQLNGPLKQNNDSFSNVGSWDYLTSDFNSFVANYISNTSSLPPQVFAGGDITLIGDSQLTDGQCSSTCSDFVNLMINQGRVKTVTVGGRPNNQPMAVIGGVQGGQVLELPTLQNWASEALAYQANATANSSAVSSDMQKLLQSMASPPPIATDPGPGSVSFNWLDNIAQDDASMTPLQFSRGIAANCRMYYMPADITNVADTWARVAKGVKAGGSGLCVNGTMSNPTPASNGTIGSAIANAFGGSNGGSPAKFQGGASVVEATKLGWIVFLVVTGSMATVLL